MVKSQIRCPDELMEWLRREANANGRSMNAQLVWMLTQQMTASMAEQTQERNDGRPVWKTKAPAARTQPKEIGT